MPPARESADAAEYGMVDGDDDEHDSLIELSSGQPRPRRSAPAPRAGGPSQNSGASKPSIFLILFFLGLAGVYYLGLQEGKSEVKSENGSSRVFPPKNDASSAVDEESYTAKPLDQPTEPAKDGRLFTRERLKATRSEANKLIEMLENYYSGSEQAKKMLLDPWIDPWEIEDPKDLEKRDRATKLIDVMARALVSDERKTFLMGGIGSSVMAGHDNCHMDSYESQMERLWQPVWNAAGMDFVFQNAGEGGGCGDSHENQVFCVKQNVSPDVDIVHYEWTYFEHGAAAPQHESLIRWTQMLPRQPPVHIFNTGEMKGIPEEDLVKQYAKYGFNAFYMKTGFYNGGHDYNAEKKREKDPFDRFSAGYVGDGYHDTTRYGELEADKKRKESLGVVMRNWHPGPMGFQLTSDAFTYVYTKALLEALRLIEMYFDDGEDPREIWSENSRPILLKEDLPQPLHCDPEYCVVDEAPGCLNYEAPTYGFWGARVEDPNDDLNPHKGEVQNWSVWQQSNSLLYMVGKQDIAVFSEREDIEMCRHLDACGGISGKTKDDGMVVFRLPKMEVGLVVICGCCGKKVAEEFFVNNQNIEIRYNTVLLDPKTFDIWPNAKCVRLLKKFPTQGRESETPTGHAYLSLKVIEDMKNPVRISHVITI